MHLRSTCGRSRLELAPCPHDHAPSLHVTVLLTPDVDGSTRVTEGRHVCPGGATEAAVWFGAAIEGLLKNGAVLNLCDAATVQLVSRDDGQLPEETVYGLLVDVPDVGEGEPAVDGLGLLVDRQAMLDAAAWWQRWADRVVRGRDR